MLRLPPTRPFLRALRVAGTVAGSAIMFAVALCAGVLLHLDVSAARRFATRELTSVLAGQFKGKIALEQVATLRVDGVSGVDVRILAADGTTVVVAHGLRARIHPVAFVKSLLRGAGDIDVGVFDIDVEVLDVCLDTDEAGTLKLRTAFEPLHPSSATGSGRPVHLALQDVTVRHASVHGQMRGVPRIDADLEGVRGAVRVEPNGVAVDVSHAALAARGMPQGANPSGAIEAHVAVPSRTRHPLGLNASFDGTIGGIPAAATAAIDGDRVDAVLDVPEVSDEKLRALVAQAPIHRPAAAHVEVHGDFASLRTTALVTIGPAELRLAGDLALVGKFAAAMIVDVRNVDLSAFSPAAPPSSLAAHADVRVETKGDGIFDGRFTLVTPRGEIDDQFVPPAAFHGDFARNGASVDSAGRVGFTVNMQGVVSEPGAPIELRVGLRTGAPAAVVDFDVSSHIARLADVKRIGGLGPGGARLRVQGTVTLAPTPLFDATLEADAEGLEHAVVRAQHARLTAHAFGSFAKPTVDAMLEAEGVQAARYRFHDAHVSAEGPLSAERVSVTLRGDGAPSLHARATIGFSSFVTLQNAEVDISRGQKALHATVSEVRADSGGVDVVDAAITGIGEPIHASFDTRRGSLVAHGNSKDVDLQALGYLLGMENQLVGGRLAFAIDLAARRDGAQGSATVDLAHGCFGSLDEVSGHIETQMQGRTVTGVMQASLGGVGTLDVNATHLKVGGHGPLEVDSWRRTWGALRIHGQVDLAKVAALLPSNTLPVAKLAGQLTLEGHIRRDDESDVTPDLAFTIKTSGVTFAKRRGPDDKTDGTTLVATPAWQISGIDVELDVRADGDSGFAEIAARLVDKEGALVSLDAKSAALPYGPLFASSEGAGDLLKDVPFSALILVPSRKLDRLPDILEPTGASGDVEARASIEGTYRKPTIDAQANMHSVKFDASPLSRRFDADLRAKYDGASGDILLDARSSKSGELHGSAHVNAKVEDWIAGKASVFPWDASAKATFARFPLGAIAALSDREVRGEASGHIELVDLHKDARANVDLEIANLSVGAATFRAGQVKVAIDGHALEASARLEQESTVASADAKVAMTWGTNIVPSIDPSGSAVASLQAKHFPAAVLAPLTVGVFDELEGTIDADARISLRPNEKPELSGGVMLSDGLVEPTALGEEFHAVKARVLFTPDGVVRLEDLSALGTTGKLTASGVVRLDGLRLVDAEAALTITKGDGIPLDLQGAAVGTVYGQFGIKATSSSDRRTIHFQVDVPSLHVELPEESTHSVQELDESGPQTHVGVYVSPQSFVVLALDGLDAQQQGQTSPQASNALTVDVHLGPNIEIQRGTDLKVGLEGDVTAKMGQETEVTGQIHLKSGKLDVQGKAFEIQTGVITFSGDPSNPEVNVTASWTAEDGTRVYADYVGPLKTGKVFLRSEPARPQNEILALILFGTAGGSQTTPYGSPQTTDTATKVGTTVGGFATAGLSKGLNKLTGIDITTKIDTSGANPRPEVAVQIARDISLELAFVLGALPQGTNQDTTYATIDWRFFKDWSLQTTFGNLGSSIADIVWQHRY